MKLSLSLITSTSLIVLNACGKKADPAPTPSTVQPPTATPVTKAPETVAPATKAPETVAPPATVAPPVEPAPAPTTITQPSWWAPLFEKGKASEWDVKETVVETEQREDGSAGKTTTKELAGKLSCTVKDVKPETTKLAPDAQDMAVQVAEVECSGYAFEHGVDVGPHGIWVSDGKTLWKRIGDTGEEIIGDPPAAKSKKDDETELTIQPGETPDTWCWRLGIIIGDGGVSEMCFDKSRGPVKFFGHGGSALVESKVTVTPH